MALEAVVYPQDLLGYSVKEMYGFGGGSGSWGWELDPGLVEEEKTEGLYGNWEASCSSAALGFEDWDVNVVSPSPELEVAPTEAAAAASGGRRKRRRTKSSKNKEEVENQRMTHIAVERNRRKQMNEYLAVLRSLMPPSYVQKGDQASIIGGAINFVKELEQLLQSLEVHKQLKEQEENRVEHLSVTTPLARFFTFPQYSSTHTAGAVAGEPADKTPANPSAVANIEVTMVENHANLKVLTRRRPKQLLKLVVGLQNLRLTTLHLNVTTVEPMVLYSFSLKVEEDCQLNSVNEIAAAVNQMVGKIEEETGF
ncbi:Transcription factor bHLH96 [Apostasia shenzhenica]|uniref:Transcription factor bHLH96 n=1 Tax=Apostasia shenzhenica TaxID=1088818 RepID=A0A2I0ACC0_9ASPA|nr:Transcription factor bHLH96 [Apostasia shenzhenica]